jgi:predicted AlkP superfamily pyrophosphatase or phosphodiesterase
MRPGSPLVAAVCPGAIAIVASWFVAGMLPEAAAAESPRHVEHVVVVVWDGLRPDTVNEPDTPALCRLAKRGTTFANQHCVYLSSTEVNGTALATGDYPQHTGIVANDEYRPEIDPLKPVAMQSDEAVRNGDRVAHGAYIAAPTMAEILQQTGRWTVVAGSKSVALLLDRRERSNGAGVSGLLYEGKALPAALDELLVKARGKLPEKADATAAANKSADAWTTQAVTDTLWSNGVPALTMLWLSEPDYAQHGSGPNSDVARKALQSSDENLARIVKALENRKLLDATAIFVVSDHGFSTIDRAIDTAAVLNDAGFHAYRKFATSPAIGDVMVVGNGGTVCLYVTGHDKRTVQRIVEFLQETDFAGVILSRFEIEGTFPLSAATIDAPTAPDIVVSLRWTCDRSRTGLPGMVGADAKKRSPGQGIHASLSRYDMHNTLIAAGPGIRRDFVDMLPSGNADVAPTVLALLGISSPSEMDGRVLEEALSGNERFSAQLISETLEARHRGQHRAWRQYLHLTRLGSHVYLDEGNGEATPLDKLELAN